MRNFLRIFIAIELLFIFCGMVAISVTHLVIRNEELQINKERQEGLKVHTVYKNCLEEEDNESETESN